MHPACVWKNLKKRFRFFFLLSFLFFSFSPTSLPHAPRTLTCGSIATTKKRRRKRRPDTSLCLSSSERKKVEKVAHRGVRRRSPAAISLLLFFFFFFGRHLHAFVGPRIFFFSSCSFFSSRLSLPLMSFVSPSSCSFVFLPLNWHSSVESRRFAVLCEEGERKKLPLHQFFPLSFFFFLCLSSFVFLGGENFFRND